MPPSSRNQRSKIALMVLSAVLFALTAFFLSRYISRAQSDREESLPPGVRIETVLANMNAPIAMAFDPAGRLFYTEKATGNVRLFANSRLQDNPVINFNVDANGEQGLLGLAIDPDFNANHYIYIYYTCKSGSTGCTSKENRVVRFVENNAVGSNPTIIFTSPNSESSTNHNGGNIHFGPDGKLYISIGDDANAANAQDVTTKNGKMHRINRDGSTPTDNPRFNSQGALPTLYAMGIRNTFDFTFDPVVKGRIFGSENGPNCDDEMNRIEAGGNYGWRAGYPCDDANPERQFNTINPLWFLDRDNCCEAPTGIIVYTGNQIPQWKNSLFMATYSPGKLYHYNLNNDRTLADSTTVISGVKVNMDLETGPDGALYYMEGGGYAAATLKRIVGTNSPPTITPGGTPVTIPGSGGQIFPETGRSVRGIFLDYWKANGGLAQQGYPISELMNEVSDLNGKSYAVQYFERAVFEYHPEQREPEYRVLLSQLGTFRYREKYPSGAAAGEEASRENAVRFAQTGHTLGGKFRSYWESHGGLAQQGYPISEEFTEVSPLDGKSYTVQYFERAVFELHPEYAGTPYEVLLSQLGTFRYKAKYGK